MNNRHGFFNRLCHFQMLGFAAASLISLAFINLAGCSVTPPSQAQIQTDNSRLLNAARDGNLEKVKMLLKANPYLLSAKDLNGNTPLHLAASNDHINMVESLLASHSDVNAKNKYGSTPLSVAALWGYKDVVVLLLANGADVNAVDINGDTPLALAMFRSYKEIVELLHQHGGHE